MWEPDLVLSVQEEKRATEDEMTGWHHQLSGHEFEQILGDSEGQGRLVCCSPWGGKESDTTEWLNNNLYTFKKPSFFSYGLFLQILVLFGVTESVSCCNTEFT